MIECLEERDFRIMRETACKTHTHVFAWTSNESKSAVPSTLLCDCGCWSWHKWSERNDEWEYVARQDRVV